jgi:diguanylate cyclase (GGDEF)-like protein
MYHRPSLRQILVVAFALLCTLPVLLLAGWLYFGIKDHALDEARDKNQLLSQNLATPIHTYLAGARQTLGSLSILLDHGDDVDITASVAGQQPYFRTVLLLSPSGVVRRWPSPSEEGTAAGDATLLTTAAPFFAQHQAARTGVIRHPYTGEPTVLFAQPIRDQLVVGLLDLAPIIDLGRRIKFGERGHAAITDEKGNVVLHPNSNWIKDIRSIADWKIIQAGMQGGTGVMTFFSPFVKQDMIAGYAAVPEFNWVVITPQPLAEFEARGDTLLHTAGLIAFASILLGLALAVFLSGRIAGPISALANLMKRLPYDGYQAQFPELGSIAPRELEVLQRSSAQMAREIGSSLSLRDNLNQELKRQVDEATRNLQEANTRLAAQAFIDDLTKLSNRRALWKRVSDMERSSPETYLPVQVLLFDLDNFKEINDTFGHAVGDRVLTQVAAVMARETREGDFVVRYGGDEFLIVMHHCLAATAQRRAEAIRQAVLSQPVEVDGHILLISMSVGIAESESRLSRPSFAELLKAADTAMYAAKRVGRPSNYLVKSPG